MDLQFTAQDQAFRAEVRDFLQGNLPPRIRDQVRRAPSYLQKADVQAWHKIVHGRGWTAPNWPKQFGGTGWTVTQKHIYDEEYQRAYAPRLSAFGLTMVGPVIYTFGTEAQKKQHLPSILN